MTPPRLTALREACQTDRTLAQAVARARALKDAIDARLRDSAFRAAA